MKTGLFLASAALADGLNHGQSLMTATLTERETNEINSNAKATALAMLDSTDDPSGIQQNVSPADAAEVAGPDSIPLFIRALCFHPKKRETDVAGQGAIQTKFSVPTKDDYNNPANYAGWCANFLMCLKKKVGPESCKGADFYAPRDEASQGEHEVGATAEERAAHNEAKYADVATPEGAACRDTVISSWAMSDCETQCSHKDAWKTDYTHDRGFLQKTNKNRKMVQNRLFKAFSKANGPKVISKADCMKHCDSVKKQLGECIAEPMFYKTNLLSQKRTDPYGFGLKTGTCYMSLWGYYQLTDPDQITAQWWSPKTQGGCSMRGSAGNFGGPGPDPLAGTLQE